MDKGVGPGQVQREDSPVAEGAREAFLEELDPDLRFLPLPEN